MELLNPNVSIDLKQGAHTLFIHFSSRNKPAGKFHKFPTPSSAANIYLNPGDLEWYLDGLPAYGSLDSTLANLRDVIRNAACDQVILVGSSMGAWGAAFYADALDADKALLFGTELQLNCFGGYSEANLRARSARGDLPKAVKSARCEYRLVSGSHSPSDVACAVNFLHGSTDGLFILQGLGHATAAELNAMGLLSKILDEESRGKTSSILGALQHPQAARYLSAFGDRKYSIDVLVDYVLATDDLGQANRMIVELCHDMGVKKLFRPGLEMLIRARAKFKLTEPVKLAMLRFARKAKNDLLANELIRELSANPALRKEVNWEKALIAERAGQSSDASEAFNEVVKAHLDDPIHKYASQRIADQVTP